MEYVHAICLAYYSGTSFANIYMYLRPKVTSRFSVPNISILVLIVSKLNISMNYQHLHLHNSANPNIMKKRLMQVNSISSFLCSNKNIKMSSFKSSENIQKKEGGPDRSVSDNQSSSMTLNELVMKARQIL